MKVLVSVSSKHGATAEIGDAIAEQLRQAGLEVDVIRPESDQVGADQDIDRYDAFVIGSAVYMGRWRGEARNFVANNVGILSRRPTWLFSSGPITDKADPADSKDGEQMLKLVEGHEHRLFPGRLQKESLGLGERTIVRMVHSPWGDYRPWDEIRSWADSIARELSAVPA